jgi:hypothetical protein
VSSIAAVHHALRHIDASAGDIASVINIDNVVNRSAMNPHP